MTDDAAVLLTGPRQEARAVDEGHDRDIVGVGDTNVTGDLVAGVDVQGPGHAARLVGDDRHRVAVHAGKADDGVGGVIRLNFEEAAVIENGTDRIADVVR